MFVTFRQSLKKTRGAILGWGLTLAALGLLFIPFYDTIAENAAQFNELFKVYPKELLAFFTSSGAFNFTSPEGFLSVEYFSYMPIVVGIFAVLAGSGLLAADEEQGRLDLIAAHPVSRSVLFWGRLAALIVSMAAILALGYAGVMFGTAYSIMDLDPVKTIIPFVSIFAQLILFAGLSLTLSMLLPSRQSAAMIAGIILVFGFFLYGLSHLNDTLASIEPFLPLTYYQGENWINGLKWDWFLGLVGTGLAFTLIAWWRFLRRDIRVGGEGGWGVPKLGWLTRRREASQP